MQTDTIYNSADVIDSRDIMARIVALQEERDNCPTDIGDDDSPEQRATTWARDYPEDAAELAALGSVEKQGEGYAADWHHGETLIHDDYFTRYAMELLADCGELPKDLPWYVVVDEEATARNIQADYSAIDFDGETYWIR
jgi:hypothetical protein